MAKFCRNTHIHTFIGHGLSQPMTQQLFVNFNVLIFSFQSWWLKQEAAVFQFADVCLVELICLVCSRSEFKDSFVLFDFFNGPLLVFIAYVLCFYVCYTTGKIVFDQWRLNNEKDSVKASNASDNKQHLILWYKKKTLFEILVMLCFVADYKNINTQHGQNWLIRRSWVNCGTLKLWNHLTFGVKWNLVSYFDKLFWGGKAADAEWQQDPPTGVAALWRILSELFADLTVDFISEKRKQQLNKTRSRLHLQLQNCSCL